MFLRSVLEHRASPDQTTSLASPANWLYDLLGANKSAAGKNVSESSALGLPLVYACLRLVSEAIGTLPIHIYDDEGDSVQRLPRHRMARILNLQANEEMTGPVWKQTMALHLFGWGNSYNWIARGRKGVVGLYPLLPDRTQPRKLNGRIIYQTTVDGNTFQIPSEDVLHIKGLGYDGLLGWSRIRLLREELGGQLAAQETRGKFYSNGSQLLGVLEHPGKVQDKEQLADHWDRVYQGSGNAFKTAVLEQGMKYHRIGIPPGDAQWVEQEKVSDLKIATMFGVPPQLVNVLDRVTFNNIHHLDIAFVKYTLRPVFVHIEQELRLKTLPLEAQVSRYFKFNAEALLRADYQTRTEGDVKRVLAGTLTRNEARAHEELNPLPGLDEPLTPVNTTTDPDSAGGNNGNEPDPMEPEPEAEANAVRKVLIGVAERELRRISGLRQKKPGEEGQTKAIDGLIQAFSVDKSVAEAYIRGVWSDFEEFDVVNRPQQLLIEMGLT